MSEKFKRPSKTRQQVVSLENRLWEPVNAMLHCTTLGRHALEVPYPAVSNRAGCNGCSVSQKAHQTSKGSRLPHDRSTASAVSRPRAFERSTCTGSGRAGYCELMIHALLAFARKKRKPAQLSGLFCAQAE